MSTIRTLDRAFSILRIVAGQPEGIGVSAIAQELGLAKSTISRLLTVMERWEAVERTAENRFRIGPEPVRWVGHQPFTQTLPALARPVLQRVAAETGEAVAICVLEGFQVFYLDHVPSYQDIQVRDWTGEYIPAHVSSAGKVLLAYGRAELVEAFLQQPLTPFTPQTIIAPEALRAHLDTAQQQGYAITDEEFGEGIIGLATPIFNREGVVVAALNLYGPKFRLDSPVKQMQFIEILKAEAASLGNI